MSRDTMDLRPSHGVGPFELGATLFAVLNLLRASRLAFPSVKVAFSTEHPSTSEIVINVPLPYALELVFAASSQRLIKIQVGSTGASTSADSQEEHSRQRQQRGADGAAESSSSAPRRAASPARCLKYRGRSLCPPSMDDEDSYDDDETAGARSGSSQGDKEKVNQSAVRAIRRVMGPHVAERRVATNGHHHQPNGSGTHTDEREAVQPGETMLCYPGAAFGVTTVSQWDAAPPHNSSSRAQSSERGRRGSRRRAAKLQRVIVTAADSPVALSLDNAADAWLRPDLPEKLKVASGDLRVAEIQLDEQYRPSRVDCHFYDMDRPISLVIGDTTSEDLLCDFGAPVRSFWKEDDRMSIHADPNIDANAEPQPNPYFWSHPHLGLTFQLEPRTHILAKIILHSNLPGEVGFGGTTRCAWALVSADGATRVESHDSKGFAAVRGALFVDGEHQSNGTQERPMVLDRTADRVEPGGGAYGKKTEIHGFPGIAFEVTQSGDVETVWLF